MAIHKVASPPNVAWSALLPRRLPMKDFLVASLLLMYAAWGCAPANRRIDLSQAPRLGLSDTPYEIVIYSDFQCPYCRNAAVALERLHEAYPEKITLYYKHCPLRRHRQSENAARAAEAARLQGKFWQMHDLLFDRAQNLADDTYVALAASIGLDVARFRVDMASKAVGDHVDSDSAEGVAAGLDATPYFIVNGLPYAGSYVDLVSGLKETLGSE